MGRKRIDVEAKQRAGVRLLRAARRERWEHLARNWRLHATFFSAIVVLVVAGTPLFDGDFQRGMWLGAGLTIAFGVSAYLIHSMSGAASRSSGGQAERLTADELHKLDRRAWIVIHDVEFADFNLDHVLIGPGIVYAVETKWRTEAPSDRDLQAAARQAVRAADRLRLLLKSRRLVKQVRPLVVMWGPWHRQAIVPAGRELDGAWIVGGGHAKVWRTELQRRAGGFGLDLASYQAVADYLERRAVG